MQAVCVSVRGLQVEPEHLWVAADGAGPGPVATRGQYCSPYRPISVHCCHPTPCPSRHRLLPLHLSPLHLSPSSLTPPPLTPPPLTPPSLTSPRLTPHLSPLHLSPLHLSPLHFSPLISHSSTSPLSMSHFIPLCLPFCSSPGSALSSSLHLSVHHGFSDHGGQTTWKLHYFVCNIVFNSDASDFPYLFSK